MSALPGDPTSQRGLDALADYIGALFDADAFRESINDPAAITILRRVLEDLDRLADWREKQRTETEELMRARRARCK